jgi:hypothetical protein
LSILKIFETIKSKRKKGTGAGIIISDETAVYHAWDVEPNSPAILRFNQIML